MNSIGEIHRRRAAWQRDHRALRGEAEHLVLEHLQLGVLQELLGVVGVIEDVEQLAHPAVLPAFDLRAVLLVYPVGGYAVLGHLMHVVRADLPLDAMPLRDRKSTRLNSSP